MNHKTPSKPSTHLLEAMLYVLNDPALDRDAYEQRLANDPVLGQSVAEAVGLVQDIQAVSGSHTKPMVTIAVSSSAQRTPIAFWPWSISIAASIALIACVGWRFFVFEQNNHNQLANAQLANAQLANVVNAWSDLQHLDGLDIAEDAKLRSVGLDSELSPGTEEVLDEDVPDWLISASIASVTVSIGEAIQ
jgi:hypothetical protein